MVRYAIAGASIFLGVILLFAILLGYPGAYDMNSFTEESAGELYVSEGVDLITGRATASTSATIYEPNASVCAFDLYTGWNFISLYCIPLAGSAPTILSSINESYVYLFGYDASNAADHWKSYNPDLPSWVVQQLSNISRASGYWIYMNNDATFSYAGSLRTTSITLKSGWNMIGYPRNESENVSVSLSNISFTELRTYDAVTDTWHVYRYNTTGNTIDNFTTYKGYWLNTSVNQTLIFYP